MKLTDDIGIFGNTVTQSKLTDDIGIFATQAEQSKPKLIDDVGIFIKQEPILRAPTAEETQQQIDVNNPAFQKSLTPGTAQPLPGQQPPLFQQASEQAAMEMLPAQNLQDLKELGPEVKNVGIQIGLWTKAAMNSLNPMLKPDTKNQLWNNFFEQEESYTAPKLEALKNIAWLGVIMYGSAAIARDIMGLAQLRMSQAKDIYRLLTIRERNLVQISDEELMANFAKMEADQQVIAVAFNPRITNLLSEEELINIVKSIPKEIQAQALRSNPVLKEFSAKLRGFGKYPNIVTRDMPIVTETQRTILSSLKPTESDKITEFVKQIGDQSPVIRDTITQAINKKQPVEEITKLVQNILYPKEKQPEITNIPQETAISAAEPSKPMVFETKDGKKITIEDIKPAEPSADESKTMTEDQRKSVSNAIDYIQIVTQKQGYLIPANDLYGDGTKFPGLTRKGFNAVYDDYKSTIEPPQMPKIAAIPAERAEVPTEPITPIESMPVEPGLKTKVIAAPKGVISILPHKKQLLVQIQQAIDKAPSVEKMGISKDNMNIELAKEEFGTIRFEIDGGMNIINMKEYLQDFYTKIKKTPATEPLEDRVAVGIKRSVAGNIEKWDKLIKTPPGYVTDGKILIKGESPKKEKYRDVTDETFQGIEQKTLDTILNEETKPAELQYYGSEGKETSSKSPNPVPQIDKNAPPYVVFKSGDTEYTYDQFRFNIIKKRFPNATFGITAGNNLIAYVEEKPVVVLTNLGKILPKKEVTETPAKPVEEEIGEAQYSMEEGQALPAGRTQRIQKEMPIPPPSATDKMEWEKTEPWRVNQGRNIPGVFEREIGPKLKVSKRFKKWLGAYFPMLGEYGTIKVKKLNDMRVLGHETGHFIDSVLKKFPVEATKEARAELMKASQYLRPFEDTMVTRTYVTKTGKEVKRVGQAGGTYQKYRHSRSELFADFMALYVEDTAKARELSPKFAEIIDGEYAKDKELKYIVDKLREFTEQFRPLQEYVDKVVGDLAKEIPELQSVVNDFRKTGVLGSIWNDHLIDPIWEKIKPAYDAFFKLPVIREFSVKKGLIDAVYELLRMRAKIISGTSARFIEEFTRPSDKLTKEETIKISESMQRFENMDESDKSKIAFLSNYGKKFLAYLGNESRKLGLLGEESFWNNVGQYFPFFYEVREFDALTSKYGTRPSKGLSANLSMFKKKLTDYEMGRRVMEHKLGTWPSSKAKIDAMSKEELEEIGIQAREDMGLIKSATYPVTKRVLQMIKTVTTAKMYNKMAKLPGVIGKKGDKGFAKMSEGKIYGELSGQWVSEALLKEVNTWNSVTGEIEGLYYAVLNIYKTFKVPWNPTAMTRNIVTNAIMAWFADTPIYNPMVMGKGIISFVTKNSTYELLRNNGLYKHTFASEELEGLHKKFMKANKNQKLYSIIDWAVNTFYIPSKMYGAVEDVSKTIMAQYALDNGASPAEAVKYADTALFDYSEISTATKLLKKAPLPFATWTMKAIPFLLETAFRRPWKIAMIPMLIMLFNAIHRQMLGITEEEEEKSKPDYAKGRQWVLLGKNEKGQLMWVDFSFYFPWQNIIPMEKGKLAVPQSLKISNPFMTYMNIANNFDPFTQRKIYPDYASYAEQQKLKAVYWIKSLLPDIAYTNPVKIYNSVKGIPSSLYSDPKQLDRLLFEMGTGSKIITENIIGKSFAKKKAMENYTTGMRDIARRRSNKMISAEQYIEYQKSLKEKFNEEIK